MQLTNIQRIIVFILLETPNLTQADLCKYSLSVRSIKRHIKGLIDMGIIVVRNIGFDDNGSVHYHKRYNLSHSYAMSLSRSLSDNEMNVQKGQDATVRHCDRILTWSDREGFWRQNGKKLRTASEREKFRQSKFNTSKGEQVRVNGVKDYDLRNIIYKAGKVAKDLQAERDNII